MAKIIGRTAKNRKEPAVPDGILNVDLAYEKAIDLLGRLRKTEPFPVPVPEFVETLFEPDMVKLLLEDDNNEILKASNCWKIVRRAYCTVVSRGGKQAVLVCKEFVPSPAARTPLEVFDWCKFASLYDDWHARAVAIDKRIDEVQYEVYSFLNTKFTRSRNWATEWPELGNILTGMSVDEIKLYSSSSGTPPTTAMTRISPDRLKEHTSIKRDDVIDMLNTCSLLPDTGRLAKRPATLDLVYDELPAAFFASGSEYYHSWVVQL